MKILLSLFLLATSSISFAQTAENSKIFQDYEEKMKDFQKKKEMVRKNARIEKNQQIEIETQKKLAQDKEKRRVEESKKVMNADTISLFNEMNKGKSPDGK